MWSPLIPGNLCDDIAAFETLVKNNGGSLPVFKLQIVSNRYDSYFTNCLGIQEGVVKLTQVSRRGYLQNFLNFHKQLKTKVSDSAQAVNGLEHYFFATHAEAVAAFNVLKAHSIESITRSIATKKELLDHVQKLTV